MTHDPAPPPRAAGPRPYPYPKSLTLAVFHRRQHSKLRAVAGSPAPATTAPPGILPATCWNRLPGSRGLAMAGPSQESAAGAAGAHRRPRLYLHGRGKRCRGRRDHLQAQAAAGRSPRRHGLLCRHQAPLPSASGTILQAIGQNDRAVVPEGS